MICFKVLFNIFGFVLACTKIFLDFESFFFLFKEFILRSFCLKSFLFSTGSLVWRNAFSL